MELADRGVFEETARDTRFVLDPSKNENKINNTTRIYLSTAIFKQDLLSLYQIII